MAKLLRPNEEVTEVTPTNGTNFSLGEMQSIVGGYIECLRLTDDEVMMFNEDAIRIGLPINPGATKLLPKNVLVKSPGLRGNVLVGTVIEIDGPPDEDDEDDQD